MKKFIIILMFLNVISVVSAKTCVGNWDCADLGQKCRDNICVFECGECGKPPVNGDCCGSGVKGHDGNCYCAGTNTGCINSSDCGPGMVCQSNGKCCEVMGAC
jgi:hypothetical protein